MKNFALIALMLCSIATASAQAPVVGASASSSSSSTYVKDPKFWPAAVMDHDPPALPAFKKHHAVLVFGKTNGYRDDDQNKAANAALSELISKKNWDGFVTENAAVFNLKQLKKFDVVVLNSISGNVFLPEQREAFRQWIEHGGGVVALHGSGGDHHYDWQWYVDVLLGAQFIGHTSTPQFQQGTIKVVDKQHPIMRELPSEWQRTEEWYAFDRVPTEYHTHILATLDESSYQPPPAQVMGTHPIIWTRCVGKGRVFFSALGHKAETYSEPLHLKMIDNAIDWASQSRTKGCE